MAPRFGHHDYKISYLRLADAREVFVSAVDAVPLNVGDGLTIERADGFYLMQVAEVSLRADGWRARCQVIDFQAKGAAPQD